jgi:hypothetical protein
MMIHLQRFNGSPSGAKTERIQLFILIPRHQLAQTQQGPDQAAHHAFFAILANEVSFSPVIEHK